MRHKHADEIIAWAYGATIQVKLGDNPIRWEDVARNNPSWDEDCEYRAKPETLNYRVALFERDAGGYYITTCDDREIGDLQECNNFVRWLTDWIEVEI